ncbi:hypothetical protein KUCAC02_012129 [Chaenocephalus aceratus]|uniref:Uncharacterized protein n=1 Tax=Chaenocephalus aceratus TaxID=36190 RepID=A0ACB9X9M8_CHAAC|nr:hypothetical protein KUCAC02_012129 [Chaenocephalus aceratus]
MLLSKQKYSTFPPTCLFLVMYRDDKEKIFKNVRKLKNCENKYQRISISNDYNKEDRELIRNKVEEAKAKTAADESKNYVFRVRGPPWNLRLVKLRKQE